jgi:hypothetical protein
MHRAFRPILAVAAVAGLIILIAWPRHRAADHLSTPKPAESLTPAPIAATPIPAKSPSPPVDLAARLDIVLAQLAASSDPKINRQFLAELRQFLDSLPPEIASREIRSFLAGNKDAVTSLDVSIKPGGALGDASSLRVFLLDYLGQIDRPAAGALAAQILSRYTTPDEWAVSLRNYAWANPGPDGGAYLQAKARELLSNPAWVENPSAGFLEAFDTIVHAHGTALAPELAALIRDKENRATAHAAYLTLDRLTITEPAAMLQQLIEQPALMEGREQTRANYVARADVRQPEQRSLVERYLLDPARSAQELTTFAGLYPNANYMISHNLLTDTPTPTRDDLIQHDAAALGVVREWLADPRFAQIKPQLETMRARLETFVQQGANAQ